MDQELMKSRVRITIGHIDEVMDDLKDVSIEEFNQRNMLARATSFSIVQIGEQLKRLEEIFGKEHPEIPWKKANAMRNMIVHEYVKINLDRVYDTVKNDLPGLKENLMTLLQ